MAFLIAHAAEIASILLAISELLGLAGKGGLAKVVIEILKKIKSQPPAA